MYQIVDVNPVIFRGYDLRGLVNSELSEDVMYTLGRAYATYLAQRRIQESTVGRDNRLTSEAYSKAFIQGLNDGGINTFDLGLSLSQIVYFSAYEFKTKGSVMITASHNPKDYNGMKIGTGYSETMVTADIKYFKEIVNSKKFSEGKGINQEVDIFDSYKKHLLKHFVINKKWKIVVDTCNTTSGKFYPDIFRAAGCEVIEQNTELDGNFPLGTPDPTEKEVLERLGHGVIENKADLGFAYDSDGDRMAVVDGNGRTLWMDTIVALFAKDVLDFIPGAPIVYNNLCSKQVQETIISAGGKPVMWLTGHSFIKAKVKEENSPFGGELSGHIYFTDNFYGHDDGAYASLRLLQYLERRNITLAQAVDELPQYISSPEIKLGLADNIKFDFISSVVHNFLSEKYSGGEFSTIDGVRVDNEESMIVIRASQNGPYITIKFEAKTQKEYGQIKVALKDFFTQHSEIGWDKGVNIKALD
jgi:phosphomannomutase/phosphoglucomutase